MEPCQNKLILVGENGTGKSTVANFIYFFLTEQWYRLLEYEFDSILAIIDGKEFQVKKDDLVDLSHEEQNRNRRLLPPSIRRELELLLRKYPAEELIKSPDKLYALSRDAGVPASLLLDYIMRFTSDELPLSNKMQEMKRQLSEHVKFQVLYLPTYRRIEQDLRAIFPGLEETREIKERLRRRPNITQYIEFVEFGMEDVDLTIKNKMTSIKDNVRNGLSDLTWTYLRDVIRNAYRSADLPSKIRELSDTDIDSIFYRVPKEILSEDDLKRLRKMILAIKEQGSIEEQDEVIAHFLTQLIDLYKSQQEEEKEVKEFVKICNEYLTGKEIIYDSKKFEIFIQQKVQNNQLQIISLKMLSSGEKQIVSLFSHIFLSSSNDYFVIIDEPELSLSVPWQKRFLPNIVETSRCKGLIAVTHSPFIFDNKLEKYVHSLEEFVEIKDVVS